MNIKKIEYLVKSANDLIDVLRIETDYDTEDTFWEFEEDHIQWIELKELVGLSSLAYKFSIRCDELIDEIVK